MTFIANKTARPYAISFLALSMKIILSKPQNRLKLSTYMLPSPKLPVLSFSFHQWGRLQKNCWPMHPERNFGADLGQQNQSAQQFIQSSRSSLIGNMCVAVLGKDTIISPATADLNVKISQVNILVMVSTWLEITNLTRPPPHKTVKLFSSDRMAYSIAFRSVTERRSKSYV